MLPHHPPPAQLSNKLGQGLFSSLRLLLPVLSQPTVLKFSSPWKLRVKKEISNLLFLWLLPSPPSTWKTIPLRVLSYIVALFPIWVRICKRLRSPGIDSKESIPGLLSFTNSGSGYTTKHISWDGNIVDSEMSCLLFSRMVTLMFQDIIQVDWREKNRQKPHTKLPHQGKKGEPKNCVESNTRNFSDHNKTTERLFHISLCWTGLCCGISCIERDICTYVV
jgi:hypothetical protein